MTGEIITEAVLLVGGLGTRLRPLTYRLPKALIPVANLPLIAYEIIPLVQAGVRRIVLAVGYKADLLREQLGEGERWGAELIYVEEYEKLDTAGAIGNVREHLSGPFFALNGDMIYDVDLAALGRAHLQQQALVTLCLRRVADIRHFGLIEYDDRQRVTAFREKVEHDPSGRNTVNSGFYVMSPEVLEHLPVGQPWSNERNLFPDLIAGGYPVLAHLPATDGYWADVGRVETYLQASGDVLAGRLSWWRRGPQGEVAEGAEVAGSVDVAPGALVAAGARVGPRVAVGANCVIERGAVVEDCILWPGSVIAGGTQVRGKVVAGGRVGPEDPQDEEVIGA